MNKQEAFEKAWHGIIKQGAYCVSWIDNELGCRLKFNGKSCAIGFLIPDNKYYLDMENEDINKMDCLADLHEPLDEYQATFLEDLRECHDKSAFRGERCGDSGFLDSFKERMRNLAKKHNLTVPSEK